MQNYYFQHYLSLIPDCILCTQHQRSPVWTHHITTLDIGNIGVSLAWGLYGMQPGSHIVHLGNLAIVDVNLF